MKLRTLITIGAGGFGVYSMLSLGYWPPTAVVVGIGVALMAEGAGRLRESFEHQGFPSRADRFSGILFGVGMLLAWTGFSVGG